MIWYEQNKLFFLTMPKYGFFETQHRRTLQRGKIDMQNKNYLLGQEPLPVEAFSDTMSAFSFYVA